MNSQLQLSSIREILLNKGEIYAKGRVKSESMQEEMSLIGFVPYLEGADLPLDLYSTLLQCDLNAHLIVTPFFIRYSDDKNIYPVFKSISLTKGNKYKVNKNLIIETIYGSWVKGTPRLSRPFYGDNIISKRNLKGFPSDRFETDENKEMYYLSKEQEFVLTESLGDVVCISDYFLCLCSFINSVTGMPSYTVFIPDDLIKVLPKE